MIMWAGALMNFDSESGFPSKRRCEWIRALSPKRGPFNSGEPFYATEKLDGFSVSFGWVDGQFV